MAGISSWEALVLLLLVLLVVGPDKVPEVAAQVARWVRTVRTFLDGMKAQVADELGDVNLKDLDPREYDPRKIVRDALTESPGPRAAERAPLPAPGTPAPFDDEAT